MALPFVGVGLLYRHGYFHQTIDADGHQEHAYPDYDLTRLPVSRVQGRDGEPLHGPGRAARVATSRSRSGSSRSAGRRCSCSTPTSPRTTTPTGRSPTSSTSAAARCGSTRSSSSASAASGRCGRSAIEPAVWHLNEGHSAFLLAERARELRRGRRRRSTTAWDRVRADSVFTIHTPVSAGNERFAADLVRRVAGPLLEGDGRPHTGGVPIDARARARARASTATRASST